jgi:ferritin-like metal-binding protein YciE
MPFRSLKDLYVEQLRDLYDAEQQISHAIPKMIQASSSSDLRQTFQKHLDETRFQVERLDLIFKKLGEAPQGRRCRGIAGIIEEGDELMQEGSAPDVADAALIASAQRVEHYEIAAYGCARTFANRLDDEYASDLLQQTLDEEEAADQSLTNLAEGGINQSAGRGKEIRDSRLTYVNRSEVRGNQVGFADVRVVGAANDDLGAVDGFLVDRSSGRPYYVVVDSGGWFTGSRYVLPINAIQFDRPGNRMRATLDKDTIKKYPKFENDVFESAGDRGWQYEQRLFETYAPGPDVAGSRREDWNYERYEQFRQPEWWITEGVAVTRSPDSRGASTTHDRPSSRRVRDTVDEPGVVSDPAYRGSDTSSEGRSIVDEPRPPARDRTRRR